MKSFIKKIIEAVAGILARIIIKRHQPLIIGVTGSVGKTSTKDAIYTVISSKYDTGKSWGNLNTELGLPLAVAGLTEFRTNVWFWFKALMMMFKRALIKSDQLGDVLILEMAADKPGDIDKLVKIAPPNVGVITNIGISHLENFKKISTLVAEKQKLVEALDEEGSAILCGDDKRLVRMIKKIKSQVITYGIKEDNLVLATNISIQQGAVNLNGDLDWGMNFKLNYHESVVPVKIKNVLGIQQIYSVLAAASAGLALGMNLVEIAEALRDYMAPKGRMNVIKGIGGSVIIDDTYNSAPASALSALEVMGKISARRKIVVLADMLELGSKERQGHKEVGKKAAEVSDVIFTYGERAAIIAETVSKTGKRGHQIARHFETQEELINELQGILKEKAIVLVKGSQGMRMERVVKAIMNNPEQAADLLVRQSDEWLRKV